MSERRVVCLNCMDGRTQLPVIDWIKKNDNADYVDMVTEPGMDGLLSDAKNSIESVVAKVNISIEKNDAQVVFVVGHHDCRGNPVDDSTHQNQVKSAVKRLKTQFTDKDVIGLWVNSDWTVEPV